MATVQQAQGCWPPPGLPELHSGDMVYVLGFDFAEVISFSCCISKVGSHRRRGGRNGDRVHIQYVDGTVFHARRCKLHLLDPQPNCDKSLQSSACVICEQHGAVISFWRDSPVCSGCWIHWEKTQCCQVAVEMSSAHLWDFLSTTPLCFEMPKEEMDLSLRRYFSQMHELRSVVPQPDFVTTARFSHCTICQDLGVVLSFSCSHSACLECWISWANAQVESSLYCSHPSTVRCWGETCEAEMSNAFWDFLLKILSSAWIQRRPVGELRLLLSRRRLQANPLFPQAMQVDCCRPDCIGLGYLGSDTVQCFICNHQWSPQDNHVIADGEGGDISGSKRCPKCHVCILKNGGCDHMTCIMCQHQFWWSTLQPYLGDGHRW